MTADVRTLRVREVRRRLVRDGPAWTRDRERDFETVTLPERDCDLLRDLLVSEGAGTVVEVGLAYGGSALAIGEALVTVDPPHPRHVIIDPFQERAYSNVGWDLLCAAGLDRVRPGGLVVMDDNWAPSVRTAVHYYQRNLGWMAIGDAFAGGTMMPVGGDPGSEPVTRCLAFRLPDSVIEPPFEEFHPS